MWYMIQRGEWYKVVNDAKEFMVQKGTWNNQVYDKNHTSGHNQVKVK